MLGDNSRSQSEINVLLQRQTSANDTDTFIMLMNNKQSGPTQSKPLLSNLKQASYS